MSRLTKASGLLLLTLAAACATPTADATGVVRAGLEGDPPADLVVPNADEAIRQARAAIDAALAERGIPAEERAAFIAELDRQERLAEDMFRAELARLQTDVAGLDQPAPGSTLDAELNANTRGNYAVLRFMGGWVVYSRSGTAWTRTSLVGFRNMSGPALLDLLNMNADLASLRAKAGALTALSFAYAYGAAVVCPPIGWAAVSYVGAVEGGPLEVADGVAGMLEFAYAPKPVPLPLCAAPPSNVFALAQMYMRLRLLFALSSAAMWAFEWALQPAPQPTNEPLPPIDPGGLLPPPNNDPCDITRPEIAQRCRDQPLQWRDTCPCPEGQVAIAGACTVFEQRCRLP